MSEYERHLSEQERTLVEARNLSRALFALAFLVSVVLAVASFA